LLQPFTMLEKGGELGKLRKALPQSNLARNNIGVYVSVNGTIGNAMSSTVEAMDFYAPQANSALSGLSAF
jgi:hypothetical protein